MRQWTVDAFADRPFRGNPACVVEPFDAWPSDAWMQALAEENKQAETAFLRRTETADRFDLRWFTPTKEVELCGHATLASAHVLSAELGGASAEIAFDTRWSGRLAVRRRESGYVMDLPGAAATPVQAPAGLAEALGATPVQVCESRYLLVVLENEQAVRDLRPDISALADFGESQGARGNVIVCAEAASDRPYQVVSRFFAPGSGIAEDPATGSAHCILGPYWAARLGKLSLQFHQAYPGRGAELHCEVAGERVWVGGGAITVMESRLRVQP